MITNTCSAFLTNYQLPRISSVPCSSHRPPSISFSFSYRLEKSVFESHKSNSGNLLHRWREEKLKASSPCLVLFQGNNTKQNLSENVVDASLRTSKSEMYLGSKPLCIIVIGFLNVSIDTQEAQCSASRAGVMSSTFLVLVKILDKFVTSCRKVADCRVSSPGRHVLTLWAVSSGQMPAKASTVTSWG